MLKFSYQVTERNKKTLLKKFVNTDTTVKW